MPELSAREARAERVRVLGQELGETFDALWQEVVWLHFEWRQFLTLFAQSQEGVDALNKVAPAFFYIVQRTLWEHVLLSVTRLTGPTHSGTGKQRQANLTVRRLPELSLDPVLKKQLGDLIEARASSWLFAKGWRDKYLAHRDLHVALERAAPLEPVSRAQVEGALSALRDTLNFIERECFDSETGFDLRTISAGADELLRLLAIGKREDDARRERLRAGRPLPGDF